MRHAPTPCATHAPIPEVGTTLYRMGTYQPARVYAHDGDVVVLTYVATALGGTGTVRYHRDELGDAWVTERVRASR